jgi:hypothetical protein
VKVTDVFPSQIVEYIDGSFPADSFQDENLLLNHHIIAPLSALLALIDKVPQHLIALDRSDFALLTTTKAFVSIALRESARLRFKSSSHMPYRLIGPNRRNAVLSIRDLFAKCSDEAPHPKTAGLAFLTDDDLRASLRADLDQADRAMRDGHWKSATVLAGAVAEALLLWSVRRDWKMIEPTLEKKLQSRELEEWDLKDYVAVAHRAKIISEEACKQCELCREFRNLIHPGRENRLGL